MYKDPRILIMRGGAVGDFIVTLPVLQMLRKRWPGAWLEVMGYPHIASLALQKGLVNQVVSLDQSGAAHFFSLRPVFDDEQREYIQSFDLVFCYLHDPGRIVIENLENLGVRQVIYGSPIIGDRHAVDHFLQPLEQVALYGEEEQPRLELEDDVIQAGSDWLTGQGVSQPWIIHPGSGGRSKCWPIERFTELAAILQAQGADIVFMVGEADREQEAFLRERMPQVPMLSNKPLLDVAGVLAAGRGYIGNDSGITHLAAALGLSVTALFGPSDPALWGPRGTVNIIRAPQNDLAGLTINTVVDSLAEK